MFCSSCGTELHGNVNYCPTCGSQVAGEDDPIEQVISSVQKYDINRLLQTIVIVAGVLWWIYLFAQWNDVFTAKTFYSSNDFASFQIERAINQLTVKSMIAGAITLLGVFGSFLVVDRKRSYWVRVLVYSVGVSVYVLSSWLLVKIVAEHIYYFFFA
jgi:hypothetical protein